jgi:HK97 gp10 family phage protein
MGVDVSQMYTLADDLKKSGRSVRKELNVAVTKVTEQVKEAAKAKAPVGPTGNLRDSIESTVRGTRGEVGTDLEYAQYVEFGTYKDEPEPFIGPAGDTANESLPPEVEAAVIRALGF